MKMNFKYAIMTVAALAMGLTSCSNDENETPENVTKELTIKISGVNNSGTKAVETPAESGPNSVSLIDGYVFIIDRLGNIAQKIDLNVMEATSESGQVISGVSLDSKVYVVGNIPDSQKDMIDKFKTFSEIETEIFPINSQRDYSSAILANIKGEPVTVTLGGNGTVEAKVFINPIVSRIELAKVKGTGNIKDFTITGVYIDSYYNFFTYVGGHGGSTYEQGSRTNSIDCVGDKGSWKADGDLVAKPNDNNVWAHNVVAGALPRFIISLTDVKYEKGNEVIELPGTYYLTVTGYRNNDGSILTSFERGNIYRIGSSNSIEFDEGDLDVTPNPVGRDLTLNVSIRGWILNTPTAEL